MKYKMKAIALAVSLACSQAANAALLDLNLSLGLLGGTATSTTAVSIGEGAYANESSVSVGKNAGAGSVGVNSTYIGRNTGLNAIGAFNTGVGYSVGNGLVGSVNSILGAGIDDCQISIRNPFGTGCGSLLRVTGNSNSMFGNLVNVTVLGDRNLAAGTNSGSLNGNDNISFGTNAGPGYFLGDIYLSNDFNSAFVTPIAANATISIGERAASTESYSISIGSGSSVLGNLSDPAGSGDGYSSIAIGTNALVSGTGSTKVAIGSSAEVTNSQDGIAIGSVAKVTANNSVALGAGSLADQINTVSIGTTTNLRRLVNVDDAINATDAVNLRTVQRLISDLSVSVPIIDGGGTAETPPSDLGDPGIDIGPEHTAIGINAAAAPTNVSLGTNATATGNNNVAIGNNSATNVGDNATVSFGNLDLGITRRLTNLADGVLNSDAATIGQVNNLFNTFVSNLPVGVPVSIQDYTDENGNTTLGDGAGTGNTGSNNTFIGQNAGSTTGTSSNSVAVGDGAKSGNNAVALGAGSVAEDNTVSVGSVGNERQVKNVADGSSDTDAVNVRQLNTVASSSASVANETRANSTAIRGLDTRINTLSRELKEVARRAYGGTALALAMTNGTTTNPGQAQLQIGVGTFNGEHALALSTTMANEKGTVFSLGGGFTSEGDIGVRAGVSFTWDPEWTK